MSWIYSAKLRFVAELQQVFCFALLWSTFFSGEIMPNHEDFLHEVGKYQRNYRRVDLPTFEISDRYDMFPAVDEVANELRWPAVWPYAHRAGVYAFFDEHDQLLYVGKASMRNTIGSRLASYCGYADGRNSPCRLYHAWRTSPKYVCVVAVPQNSRFEAPALEEYLISTLQPPENSRGIDAR